MISVYKPLLVREEVVARYVGMQSCELIMSGDLNDPEFGLPEDDGMSFEELFENSPREIRSTRDEDEPYVSDEDAFWAEVEKGGPMR